MYNHYQPEADPPPADKKKIKPPYFTYLCLPLIIFRKVLNRDIKMGIKNVCCSFKGSREILAIKTDNKVGRKMAMLLECMCMGISPSEAAEKYGYSRQYYYRVLDSFNLKTHFENLAEKLETEGINPKIPWNS